MPGAALSEDEFRQLEEQVLEIESGAILVISGSLPPGVKLEKLTQLISAAQKQGIRCIVDSSGEALSAALAIGNIELVKPNQKELSALVNRELTQPDDVRKAAQEIVNSGKAKRVVVSLGPQGALGVDSENCIQVVPPPVKSQSTVGAGDSMVGAGDVDAAASGFEYRCGTAQLSFGINLRGNCCAIERGRKCQRIDTYHHFLL